MWSCPLASILLLIGLLAHQTKATPFLHSRKTSATILASSNLLQLRSGAVEAMETLSEVEDSVSAAGKKLVVIDFTASWCGPCQHIAPLYKDLSEQHNDVVFLKVDVDENSETAAKYKVSAMPTFVFIKQGEIVDRLMGADIKRLRELVVEHKK